MKRMIFNEKGFTLTETVAVIAISSLLILTAAVGIGVFFRKYQELSVMWIYKRIWFFLNVLKYGLVRCSDIEFMGITSARELKLIRMTTIPGVSKGIEIKP